MSHSNCGRSLHSVWADSPTSGHTAWPLDNTLPCVALQRAIWAGFEKCTQAAPRQQLERGKPYTELSCLCSDLLPPPLVLTKPNSMWPGIPGSASCDPFSLSSTLFPKTEKQTEAVGSNHCRAYHDISSQESESYTVWSLFDSVPFVDFSHFTDVFKVSHYCHFIKERSRISYSYCHNKGYYFHFLKMLAYV